MYVLAGEEMPRGRIFEDAELGQSELGGGASTSAVNVRCKDGANASMLIVN